MPRFPGAPTPGGAALLEHLRERELATQTLTSLFQISATRSDGGRESTRGALAVARPARLRLQIFSLGFVTVYDMTIDGDRFRERLPLEGKETIGRIGEEPSRADLFHRYDLRPLFLGLAPKRDARVEDAGPVWRVESGRRVIEVGKADGLVGAEEVHEEGHVRLRARYHDYRDVDGFPLPFSIHVEYPISGVTIDIRVTSYTRNQPIESKVFEF